MLWKRIKWYILILLFSSLALFIFILNSEKPDITKVLKVSLLADELLAEARQESKNANIEEDKKNPAYLRIECDVLVAGGGAGGVAAAIQSGRMGAKTCLIEKTDWLGGMLTSAGVSAIDGMPDTPSGIFREFVTRLKQKYGSSKELDDCDVSYLCYEPSMGDYVLKEMAKETPNLYIFFDSSIDRVYREANQIKGVRFQKSDQTIVAEAKVTIDATEFGDLMYLADIPYDIGIDEQSREPHARLVEDCVQPITYVAMLQKKDNPVLLEMPENYDESRYICVVKNNECPFSNSQFGTVQDLLDYGAIPNGKVMVNIPSHSYGNDFHAFSEDMSSRDRNSVLKLAKDQTLGLIYFLQNRLGLEHYALSNEFLTEDHLAKIPYVRESRRLQGVYRLVENDILPAENGRSVIQPDAIAIGDYPIDLHFCTPGKGDIYYSIPPYQIPYGVAIPAEVDGFMAAEKNISVSHIVNGTTRMQPVVMSVGQAVGAAAAMSARKNIQPREVNIEDLQEQLLKNGSRILYFRDVTEDHFSYPYIVRLALQGVVKGYGDLTFKPEDPILTPDFISVFRKMGSSAGVLDTDKNPAASMNIQSGFLTRGHAAEIIATELQYARSADGQENMVTRDNYFRDVPNNNTYYESISSLVEKGIISEEHEYFRPYDYITRAEAITMLVRSIGHF